MGYYLFTREDDIVSRAVGEWRNSSERVCNSHYPRVEYILYFFYDAEEKLINKFYYWTNALKIAIGQLDYKLVPRYDICSEF
jgi:hypothetical protein